MQTSQCLSTRSLQQRRGPVGLPNLMKLGEKEEDVEEKKEDDDEEEEMEGKRMYEKDLQDSLMV